MRIDKSEETIPFTQAQVIYYFCDKNYAIERSWELEDGPEGDKFVFRVFPTWNSRLDGLSLVFDVTDSVED